MDMPPSRYRVVERGRRLVVIDTHHGNMSVTGLDKSQQARIDKLGRALRAPEPPRESQHRATPQPTLTHPPIEKGAPAVLTTQSWFDDKAPRRVRVGEGQQGGLATLTLVVLFGVIVAMVSIGWPALVLFAFLLLQPRVRKGLRKAMTRWIDGLEQLG